MAIDTARQQGKYVPYALIDELDYGRTLLGIQVLRDVDNAENLFFIVAIGDNRVRKEKYEHCLSRGWNPATIIHPSAVIAQDVSLGQGTVVFAGAVINPGVTIGVNSIINTGATVDHDCSLAAHVHIAPGCHLAGEIGVGEGALLGIGTVAIPKIKVGEWAIIGAGAVIVDDVLDKQTVVGVPARPLQKRRSPSQP